MSPRFWQFARPYRATFRVGLVFLVLTNGLSLGIPWLLRNAIHSMETGASPRALGLYAAGIAGLALAQAAARTLSRLKILGTSRRIAFDIRNTFFGHLQTLGAAYYDTHRTGDIMSRGINDVQILQSFYGPGVMNALNTAIVYVAVLTLLFRIDAGLTLVSLGLFPLLYLGVNRLSKRVYRRSLAVQEQLAVISNRAQENLSGIQQVKIYVQEEAEINRFRRLCDDFRHRNLALARIRGLMVALIGVFSGAGTLLVLYVGGRHVIEGKITFGDFVAFNAYLGLLAWPTIALGWIVNLFQRAAGAMSRVEEVLSAASEVPPAEDGTDPGTVEGDIEIRNLSFSFGTATEDGGEDRGEPGPGTYSLRDVNLTIARGTRVALVGSVGSGKSTLANLIARVYPAPRGTIRIGGVDLRDIPVSRLRRSIGYVPQEAFLFSRSLRDNIALGRPAATDDEIERAVRLSHLAGDLAGFPEGLETVVGERGFTLSGGQRQRATLARAAVLSPRILILDDSLSSVDADTERAILDALQGHLQGRTCLLVSHRPSTLAGMDRIVVLEEGRVVEDGTHEELLALDGVYARLFRRHQLETRLDGA